MNTKIFVFDICSKNNLYKIDRVEFGALELITFKWMQWMTKCAANRKEKEEIISELRPTNRSMQITRTNWLVNCLILAT